MRVSALIGAIALVFLGGCNSSSAQNGTATAAAPPGAMTLRYASPERPNDTLTIERDTAGQVRAEDSDGQWLIIRDGTTYLNPQPPGGGERVIARLDDLVALGGEMRARMLRSGTLSATDDTSYELRDQGEASVGQWRGRRYYLDPDPNGVSLTVVIVADPALADAHALAVSVFDAFEAPMRATLTFPEQFTRLRTEVLGRGMPVLFEGRELRSIERAPVAAARFELPGAVLSREALRARFMP